MQQGLATSPWATDLINRLTSAPREVRIGVVGLGYVGLPLALSLAKTYTVLGYDRNPERVEGIGRGLWLPEPLEYSDVLAVQDHLELTHLPMDLKDCDLVIVAVPTDIDEFNVPDLGPLELVARTLNVTMPTTRPWGMCVESTVWPGCTEEVLLPLLDRHRGREGFFYGYSPERIVPGSPVGAHHGEGMGLHNTNKLVSGSCPDALEIFRMVYSSVVTGARVVECPSLKVAEASKMLENVQRDVNIALINEYARVCSSLGISIHDVLAAARTKWNFHPYGPGLVGGHCHPPQETITVRVSGVERRMTISEAHAEFGPKPTGVEILSWDAGTPVYRRLEALLEREYSSGISISLWTGRKIEATDGHTMLIQRDGHLLLVPAACVRPKDLMPVVLGVPGGTEALEPFELDLFALVGDRGEDYRVRPTACRVSDVWAALSLSKKTTPGCGNFKSGNYLPLKLYLELEREGRAPWSRRDSVLVCGRGRTANSVPGVLLVDQGFCRVLGYYVAEGCCTDTGTTLTTRWSFNEQEVEEIEDLHQVLAHKGFTFSTWHDRKNHTLHTKLSSRLFGLLIKSLGCGVDSYTARLPTALRLDHGPLGQEALKGLFRGDGWVHMDENGSATVGFYSVNPLLRQDVGQVLRRLGIMYSISANHWIQVYGHQAKAMAGWFLGGKRSLLEQAIGSDRASRVWYPSHHENMVLVPVRGTQEIRLDKVYSAEVEGTHTLVVGDGILTHNCIGVDPYYMLHRAAKAGQDLPVIRASRQSNEHMPAWTASAVVQGLATRGCEHHVLVVGATFKENCDDLRNTKVVDLVQSLQALGCQVDLYDPVAPRHILEHLFGPHARVLDAMPEHRHVYGAVVLAVPHTEVLKRVSLMWLTNLVAWQDGLVWDLKRVYSPRGLEQLRAYRSW